jgi:hypothetical protein
MIKLSELHEQRKSFVPSSDDDYFVFDVEVDEELFSPPAHVREIGVLATTTKGMVDDVVMDVLIAYHLAGLDTILEFRHEVDFFDARHLVQTAAQSNASLSFIPPVDLNDESFEAYCLKMEAIAKAYMAQQAMTRFVMPVTNYLQHMFLEVMDPEKAKSFVPEDSYVLARFHTVMPVERSDALKARIRAVIVETAGGEEGFREFALGVIAGIAASVETSLAETRERLRPAAGSHWLMNRHTGAFVAALFDREQLAWTITDDTGSVWRLSDEEAAPDYRFIETIRQPRVFKGYRVVRRPDAFHLLRKTDDGAECPAWYSGATNAWTVGLRTIADDRLLSEGFEPVGPVDQPSRGGSVGPRRSRKKKSRAVSRRA